MLSRSNSIANDRLRRAKSTSSTHTSSSAQAHLNSSYDPFVTGQQAEIAAVEAYHRARREGQPSLPYSRPVPPKLQRRRSQISGKSEGSHLEDARLGRRKSRSHGEQSKAARGQYGPTKITVNGSTGEEVVRRRYVVPPNPPTYDLQRGSSSVTASSRRLMYSDLSYADGSPVRGRSVTVKERTSMLGFPAPPRAGMGGYTNNLANLSDFQGARETTAQLDGDALAAARDRCLLGFHQNRLRERTSFILTPFQKRRTMNAVASGVNGFDNKLPPFNYADNTPPSLSVADPAEAAPVIATSHNGSRSFSGSLTSRFKKVFRKGSRVPSGLPARHIDATDFRFTTYPIPAPEHEDPFVVPPDPASSLHEVEGVQHDVRNSFDEYSAPGSRVTSWTASTATDTCHSRYNPGHIEPVKEQPKLARSNSIATRRRASSFLGRPLMNSLRRPSKAALRSSDESEGLYSALQERMQPASVTSRHEQSDVQPLGDTSSALAALPSRMKANTTISSNSNWTASTIRSVTPNNSHRDSDMLSPVVEMLSPAVNHADPDPERNITHESQPAMGHTNLQRRFAVKAPTPSQQQLAQRMERAKNRWQSPLNEMSPPMERSARLAMMTDGNPYELRSLSGTLPSIEASSDIPHHAQISVPPQAARSEKVLSPSLYSRGEDGATPRPITPDEPAGEMSVTIMGREVRRYSISPQKRSTVEVRPVQASADWRRWLSDEMGGLTGDAAVPEQSGLLDDDADEQSSVGQYNVRNASLELSRASGKAARSRRPSVKYDQRDDSTPREVSTTSRPELSNSDVSNMATSNNTAAEASSQQSAHGAESSGGPFWEAKKQVGKAYKPRSAFDLRANYKPCTSAEPKPIAVRRKSVYLNRSQSKDNVYVFEDATIQNISAGPYASLPPHANVQYQAGSSIVAEANKENTSPVPTDGREGDLHAQSKSERLDNSLGVRKRTSAGLNEGSGLVRGRTRSRSIVRSSRLSTPGVPNQGVGKGSPGQRLVTGWLEGKKEVGSSPAFM